MRGKVLKLNKCYFPIGTAHWKEAVKNVFSGTAFLLDVTYGFDEFGLVNPEKISYFEPIKTWKDWEKLEVRPYDEYIQGANGKRYRMPTVAICADYSSFKWNKVVFPTKENIWKRDNYTCQFTGKKLERKDLSVDHLYPVSRGGQNTWLNLVTADKEVNRKKADRTPEEAGLKLLRKPFVPVSSALTLYETRPEWTAFIPSTKVPAVGAFFI